MRPIAADFADLDDPNDLSDRNWVWCHVFPPPFIRCAVAHRELIVIYDFQIVNYLFEDFQSLVLSHNYCFIDLCITGEFVDGYDYSHF